MSKPREECRFSRFGNCFRTNRELGATATISIAYVHNRYYLTNVSRSSVESKRSFQSWASFPDGGPIFVEEHTQIPARWQEVRLS
jgi:hypothetical protein